MLILSRKIGEEICIGDTVELTVLEVRGGKVRLGFSAPAEVTIHREEVFRRVMRESSDATFGQGTIPAPLAKHVAAPH